MSYLFSAGKGSAKVSAGRVAALIVAGMMSSPLSAQTLGRFDFRPVAGVDSYQLLVESPFQIAEGPVFVTDEAGRQSRGSVVEFVGKTFVAVNIPGVDASRSRTYTVNRGALSAAPEAKLRKDGSDVNVILPAGVFTTHRSKMAAKPFLWPVIAPGNVDITRGWPMRPAPGDDKDHPHQKGFWFTHGSVNGVDFWNESANSGKIVQTGIDIGPDGTAARLSTSNDWIGPDGKRFLTDERTFLFWNSDDPRVFDFAITLKATDGKVVFGDTKEGTCAIRLPRWMTLKAGSGHLENAEGIKDGDVWGKRSAWVDYWAPARGTGAPVGVAILESPHNFRFPTYWHARDYGLFAANVFGIKDFVPDKTANGEHVLEPGQSLTLKYRVVVHAGDTASAEIGRIATQMLAPGATLRR